MSSVPSWIEVLCSVDAEPLGGAWVKVTLPMTGKNPIRVLFGPADDSGIVRITGAELTEAAKQVADLFPMDYLAFPGGWTGQVIAEVVDLAGIERLREAASVWGAMSYRDDADPGWVEWERRLRLAGDRQLKAEVVR